MDKVLKKAAEILVECGYAENYWMSSVINLEPINEKCDPFSDTLEGRRQADAIEDWLIINKLDSLWVKSDAEIYPYTTAHQWRLDRIKWCLEQLVAKSGP